jgi:hypothetical protein
MLPPRPESVAVTRGFILDLLVEHDLLHLADDVLLVASELASNAARHARTPFTVMLEGLTDSVRLTVSDKSAALPVRSEMPVMETTGRGLNVVSYYSRDWGVRRDGATGKAVWASFARRARARGATTQGEGVSQSTSTTPLVVLLRQVKAARAGLRTARAGGDAAREREQQKQLAAALERYVDALAAQRLPVPYQLRDELRLYGGTTAAANRRTHR